MKNELGFGFWLVFSLSFTLFWRWFLIGVPLGFSVQKLLAESSFLVGLVQIGVSFFSMVIAVKWLFSEGRFSSLKIIFMEQADYKKLSHSEDDQ